MDTKGKAPANQYPQNLSSILTSLTKEELQELKRLQAESKHLFKKFGERMKERNKPRCEHITRRDIDDRSMIPPWLNRTNVEEKRRCDLCKDELVTRRVLEEVSVMACGHVYHSTCFATLVASSPVPDSRDPPCFLCRQGNS